ncbi:uncharacterized protein LOC122756649 [Drosophila santomea]|uniref:uncharacterized protein LOC122756649 n=1 Tax=Drosophila santomea TaxID=129105 RepID=UPI001CCD3B78|nr:uncharacterized protein LOC122756649 [Drosophila santomea]
MSYEHQATEEMKIVQINLNHCEAAHHLLSQAMREVQADVALISEPYKKTSGADYILDGTRCAAILINGTRRPVPEFSAVIDELANDARGERNVVIAGDFNAWAEEWGSVHTNARGRTLQEAFASMDVALLNTGTEHTFSRAGAGSVVDLTFCSGSLFQRAQLSVSNVYTASDHDITSRGSFTAPPAKRHFNPKTLQRDAFLRESGSPDIASMRVSRSHREPVYWWTDKITEARRTCLRARRRQQRVHGHPNNVILRQEYADNRRALKRLIKQSKSRCFLELFDSAEQDPWGSAYKIVVKKLSQAKPLKTGDAVTMTAIVEHLFPIVPSDQQPPHAAPGDLSQIALRPDEIREVAKDMPSGKAPGPESQTSPSSLE